tara:strand:- start:2627 stop:2857 length:231 start_codon:yes stop_codon:yes gene_type:complete
MLSAFIEWKVVLLAFAIGLVFIWVSQTEKIPVVVHPTPDNAGRVEYVDRAGVCHTFVPHRTKCRKNPPPREIPAQF